ncbi:MAG: toll/interleukin-1 receptor domain-containing protein [Bacteroidetes bacterium]|nr:toll/interleukin-1 receptor domain-containing protein [Bacteroidota bacterium]
MIFSRGHFKSNRIQKASIINSLNESRSFSSRTAPTNITTVFLSHKHKDLDDEEELKGFIELLEDNGVKVYIDSMDNTLPTQTTGDTANRIKEIIKYCNKFVLMATSKAIQSYWCNWELGIGDVHKFQKHIAILPIKEKGEFDSQYKGNEYLQIYPRIDYENGTNKYTNGNLIPAGYYVVEPPTKEKMRYITPLSTWLKSR